MRGFGFSSRFPGRDLIDPRLGFASQLLKSGVDTSPVQSNTEGFSRLASALLGAYIQNQAIGDNTAANQALLKGASAQPWVNPDTGAQTIPQELPTGELGPSVPTGPAGGIEGGLSALSKLPDNLYAGKLSQNLLMRQMDRRMALDDETRKRKASFEDAVKLRGIPQAKPPDKGTNDEQNYERAVEGGFKGTFFDYMQAKAMASQGVIYNPAGSVAPQGGLSPAGAGQPQPGPSITVMPGSKADLQGRSIAARVKANELAEQRDDPEYILNKKLAERKATFDADNIKMLPTRRGDIMTKIEREPILQQTVNEIKELASGMMTSGVTGQVMSNIAGSDQYALDKKLETVKSAVGLEELIRVKKSGATFGALSDTEMSLLISAVGALDGNLDADQLGPVLDTVMRLYSKALGRKKSDFAEMYPDVEMPWEVVPAAGSDGDEALLNKYAPRGP